MTTIPSRMDVLRCVASILVLCLDPMRSFAEQRSEGSSAVKAATTLLPYVERVWCLEERTSSGTYRVSDDEVARLEAVVAELLHIAPPFRVELRSRPPFDAKNKFCARVVTREDATLVEARLVHSRAREFSLSLSTTLGGSWVSIGSSLYIGADASTKWERAQYATRRQYFPLAAIPILLTKLDQEIMSALRPSETIESFDVMSGDALGTVPFARASLTLKDGTTTYMSVGVLELPPECRLSGGYSAGSQGIGVGDSIIGPVNTLACLSEALTRLRETRAALDAPFPGEVLLIHNPADDAIDCFLHPYSDAREWRKDPNASLGMFAVRATGDAERWRRGAIFYLGPVSVTSKALRTILEEADTRSRGREQVLLAAIAVTGDASHPPCAAIVTTPTRTNFSAVQTLSISRLMLSVAGEAATGVWERYESLGVTVESPPLQHVWKIRLPSFEVVRFQAYVPMMCSEGIEWPKADVDSRAGLVIGGKAVGTIR